MLLFLGKIERWGHCNEKCVDKSTGFSFANMNMLTDEECDTLIKDCPACQGMGYMKKYEFCAGKKHLFPPGMLSFVRRKKSKKFLKKEKANAKKYGVKRPGKFRYRSVKGRNRISLGTKESYPYDWFIGGVDSCQGDSGGPIFHNRKVCFDWVILSP